MKKILILVILFWLGLAMLRTLNNISKIVTEEGGWVVLSQEQKKEKIFGYDYKFFTDLTSWLPPDTRVVIYSQDAKPYLLGRYILYPIKIYHVKTMSALYREMTTGNKKIFIFYNIDQASLLYVSQYFNKPITNVNDNISYIQL